MTPTFALVLQASSTSPPCCSGFQCNRGQLPGIPGVVIGHNERIAWGVTTLFADVQDAYLEELNPDNSHQYRYRGSGKRRGLSRAISGERQAAVTREVIVTRHGPIMDSIMLTGATIQIRKGLRPAVALAGLRTIQRPCQSHSGAS